MAVSGWRARWWSTSNQQEHLITQNARSYRLARFKWIIRHKITKSNKRFKQLLMCTALKFLHTLERLDSKNNLFSSASALLKGLNIQIQRWKIDWFKSMAGIRSFVALSWECGFCFCKLFHQGVNLVSLCCDFRLGSAFIFICFVTKLSLCERLWKEELKPYIYMFR